MAFNQCKYRISADGGQTWTEQWLTEAEAQEEIQQHNHLCVRVEDASAKNHWSEIRNNYFEESPINAGDTLACISIDAWKTHDDNEEGQVIARVLLSKHGDVLVDYHDNLARVDTNAQEAIQEAVASLQEYYRDMEQGQSHSTTQKEAVLLTCIHETKYGASFYSSIHPDEKAALEHIERVKEEADFEEDVAGEYFTADYQTITFDLSRFPAPKTRPLQDILADAVSRTGNSSRETHHKSIEQER